MMSEPRLGRRNSALETTASCLTVSDTFNQPWEGIEDFLVKGFLGHTDTNSKGKIGVPTVVGI